MRIKKREDGTVEIGPIARSDFWIKMQKTETFCYQICADGLREGRNLPELPKTFWLCCAQSDPGDLPVPAYMARPSYRLGPKIHQALAKEFRLPIRTVDAMFEGHIAYSDAAILYWWIEYEEAE